QSNQRAPASAPEGPHLHRRREDQFQRAVTAGFEEETARYRGDPDAVDEIHRAAEIQMKLVNARVASRANRQPVDVDGDNADQRPEYPVGPAMTAGKRVDRIGREPIPEASLPTPRSAQSRQPKPRFAVFHRLLPPDETHHQNRSDQERPAKRVNNA